MRKRVLFLSIVCLLFCILSYTYSSFKNTIVGNISGNVKDWVFKVSIDNSPVYNDGYKLHLSGASGSFNVNINTVGGTKDVDYIIELIGDSSIKFYTDSSYTNLISNNIYNGSINSNTSGTITIYYKSDISIDSDIIIKTKGNIMELAVMKNGYINDTGFWNNTYKPYIRTVDFDNNLSNLPSSCTEENLCWDISYDTSQKKKVYGYLIDSGYKDSTDNTKALYNLYIVSEAPIFAPADCSGIFSGFNNLTQINFNANFNTSKVTSMSKMFYECSKLTTLDLSKFNTSKVTTMRQMFSGCSKLTTLNLTNFNTSKVGDMGYMFQKCSSLTSLNLSNFDTLNVTIMYYMFNGCSKLTALDLRNFNTSNVTKMNNMFFGCSALKTLNISNFNTSKVTAMDGMFFNCSSLTGLELSKFNTSNVTTMGHMFFNCSSLTTLNLTGFDTSKVTAMDGMFYNCSKLTNLDLRNFNTLKVIYMGQMFYGCSSLKTLNLSGFNTSNVTNMYGMFDGCSKLTTTINIMNANVTDYSYMFNNAATASGAKITVNYTSAASSLVNKMIATKSSTSKVIKGSIIQ